MNKKFALVVSLLFFIGIIGTVSVIATSGPTCPCEKTHYTIDKTLVTVGETFTFSKNNDCTYEESATPGTLDQTIQFVSGSDDGSWKTVTFRAISPGTVTFTNKECNEVITVKILPKSKPMESLMKILGLGKND
ncbi:MAG: hypothetical protein GYA51_14545 [Candidatus Methanofastidiosa archaeon]|jgi:hypothetical protein|nr:hypothetical protein [Candidatus Methanofastidiosa archaeon]